MKLPLIIGGIVLGGILLIGTMFYFHRVGFRQECVAYEASILACDKEALNIDSEITNSLTTMGLSANEYGDLVKDAIKAANTGRYGADGSKAMMQWIKEQNPTIDSSIFKKIMTAAEAGYAKFSAIQKTKIDKARSYKTVIEQKQQEPFGGWFTEGFPRRPWDEFEKIYMSASTLRMQQTGIQEAKDPFGKRK